MNEPTLRIRRVGVDTWRENVACLHRDCAGVDKRCIGGIPGNRTSMRGVPIVAAHGTRCPKTPSRANSSPAGTADTTEVPAGVALPIGHLTEIVRAARGCLAWGRGRGAQPGRRPPDLGRAPAGDRRPGPDGGLDPVQRGGRRLDPPGTGHPAGAARGARPHQ